MIQYFNIDAVIVSRVPLTIFAMTSPEARAMCVLVASSANLIWCSEIPRRQCRTDQAWRVAPCSVPLFRGRRVDRHVRCRRTAQLFGILPSLSGGFLLLFRVTVVRFGQINLLKNHINQTVTRNSAVRL